MTGESSIKVGGILLAAGGSSRLGRPKQLIVYKGKTLLRRAAETLVNSACVPIVVVLGAETKGSIAELDGLDVTVCINSDWQTGMSSSIKAGLQNLLEIEPDLAAVVITLCDQPNVTKDDIARLVAAHYNSHQMLVAAQYGETKGVPALFSRGLFEDLLQLEGDKGAKILIRDRDDLTSIQMDHAAFDIDTLDDLFSSSLTV